TGEQYATVGTRQYACTDSNWAYGAGVAAVDTWLAAEDLAADDFAFVCEQEVVDFAVIGRGFAFGFGVLGQSGFGLCVDFLQTLSTSLLFANLVGGLEAIKRSTTDGCD